MKKVLLLSWLALAACKTTEFHGSPKVPGGAEGCRTLCQREGLEMAGMVFLGQYSDGCVCQVPGQQLSPNAAGAALAPGAAAVILRMQHREEDVRQQKLRQKTL